jgi:hypothetical protein
MVGSWEVGSGGARSPGSSPRAVLAGIRGLGRLAPPDGDDTPESRNLLRRNGASGAVTPGGPVRPWADVPLLLFSCEFCTILLYFYQCTG